MTTQPNFRSLARSLAHASEDFSNVATQIAFVPNMPAFHVQEDLQDIRNQMTLMSNSQKQFQGQMAESQRRLQEKMDGIQKQMDQGATTKQLGEMEVRITGRIDQL